MSSIHFSNIYDDDCFRLRDRFYSILYQLDINATIKAENIPNYFDISHIWRTNFPALEEREFLKCIRKWLNENPSFFIFNPDNNKIALTSRGRIEISKIVGAKSANNSLANESAENTQSNNVPLLSSSIEFVLRNFKNLELIVSIELIKSILHEHPEYASGLGRTIQNNENPSIDLISKSKDDWLQEIFALINKDNVNLLHGRLFILGICLIDKNIGKYLLEYGFLNSLVNEFVEKPVSILFTEEGQVLFDRLFTTSVIENVNDYIPINGDIPIEDKSSDTLGRWPFAKAVCNRLIKIHEKEKEKGSFLIHLYGPWGSGKSSILKLIKKELEDGRPPWIVVEFNAWERQNIGPPWWSLIDALYVQGYKQLRRISLLRSFTIFIKEKLWRLRVGHGLYLWIPTVLFAFIGISIFVTTGMTNDVPETITTGTNVNATQPLDFWGNLVGSDRSIGGIVSIIVSLLSGVQAVRNSLVPGSEHAAKEFAERSNDPTRKLKDHFNQLIKDIGQPVIILVDDLDRCNDKYSVDFLEGIQTLFREANVFYIISADRGWIYTSFEKNYDMFKDSVSHIGLPFGELFLSKIFQMSVSIPPISPAVQREYFTKLLGLSQSDTTNEMEKARIVAKEKINNLNSEDEILLEIKKTSNPIENKALREAAITRLSSNEIEKKTEHLLLPFSNLIDANPRAMKRLLNGYGLLRDIDLMRGEGADIVGRKELALWTILNFRWPSVAAYFENKPEMIDVIRKNKNLELLSGSEELKNLTIYPEIRKVIEGRGTDGAFLDEGTVRKITGKLKDE